MAFPRTMPPTNMDRLPPNRAATTPVSDRGLSQQSHDYPSSYPQVLDPRYGPQTVHRSDLLFINQGTHMSRTQPVSEFSTSPPAQLYPYHQQAFSHYAPPPPPHPPSLHPTNPHPNFHRSMTNPLPPPVPPKPFYPHSVPELNLTHPTAVDAPPPPPPSPPPPVESNGRPSSPTDEDELAAALALSQTESIQRKLREEALATQEEEELARALAESMLSTGGNLTGDHNPFFSEGAPSMSKTPAQSSSFESSYVLPSVVPHSEPISSPNGSFREFGRYEKWGSPRSLRSPSETEVGSGQRPSMNNVSNDSQASPQSFSQAPGGFDTPPEYFKGGHEIGSFPEKNPLDDRSSLSQHQKKEGRPPTDEGFTHTSSFDILNHPRYLAPGNQHENRSYSVPGEAINISDDEAFARRLAAEEEAAAQKISLHPVASRSLAPDVTGASIEAESPTELPYYYADGTSPENAPDTTAGDAIPNPEPSLPITTTSYPSVPVRAPPAEDGQFIPSSVPGDTQHRPDLPTSTISSQTSLSPIAESPHNGSQNPTPNPPLASSPPMVNPNHFIDTELLLGVSIGFTPPALSTRLLPMTDALPNIVSLPYGRCPPLHFQAPSWRHLLKLLARLSASRLEPTVAAMAVSRTDLKLRTVIQFVKPHHAMQDWRTILWFSIDQPVPPNSPGAAKYSAFNPNMLPWSYTLSPIPALLHDAVDTPNSKTYTIPATDIVPYPTLPITFPNLAMYLQAALDDSRRHSHESTGGKKLGKMVQICYPNSDESPTESSERGSVSGLFKRVIGRGNKTNKKGRASNEDTYELVTPFVPDEWG